MKSFFRKKTSHVVIKLKVKVDCVFQIYYDIGRKINEKDSIALNVKGKNVKQKIVFKIPDVEILEYRFDLMKESGLIDIYSIKIKTISDIYFFDNNQLASLIEDKNIVPNSLINKVEINKKSISFSCVGDDPYFYLKIPKVKIFKKKLLSNKVLLDRSEKKLKIAVCIHIFYTEYVAELFAYLHNLTHEYDLYITISENTNLDLDDALAKINKNTFVYKTENIGFDVKPFLEVYKNIREKKYDLILKLHTKRDLPESKGNWRILMLNSLLGSRDLVDNILEKFKYSDSLNVVGTKLLYKSCRKFLYSNQPLIDLLLKKLKLNKSKYNNYDWNFFAGSMFWIRADVLGCLDDIIWKKPFSFKGPVNSGSDGTLPHAIERIFGLLPIVNNGSAGLVSFNTLTTDFNIDNASPFIEEPTTVSVKNVQEDFVEKRWDQVAKISLLPNDGLLVEGDSKYETSNYFKREYPYFSNKIYDRVFDNYNFSKSVNKKKNKIAIYTAISGGYDSLKLHEFYNPNIDYYVFTDQSIIAPDFYFVKGMDYVSPDSTRSARYIKTHPHVYLNGYDIAIWVDGNIIIKGDLQYYIDLVINSKISVGAIPHPYRESIYDEAKKCIEAKKDDPEIISDHMARYQREGFDCTDLVESNFMIFNLSNKELPEALNLWWFEIANGSKRDQLSFNYAFNKKNVKWQAIMNRSNSIRNNDLFALIKHDRKKSSKTEFPVHMKKVYPFRFENCKNISNSYSEPIEVTLIIFGDVDAYNKNIEPVLNRVKNIMFNVILIDNSFYNEREITSSYNVKVINNESNKNYLELMSECMKFSSDEIIIMVNDGVIFDSNVLISMINSHLEDNYLGVISPITNRMQSLIGEPDKILPLHLNEYKVISDGLRRMKYTNNLNMQFPFFDINCFAFKRNVFLEYNILSDLSSFSISNIISVLLKNGYKSALASAFALVQKDVKFFDYEKNIENKVMLDIASNILKKWHKIVNVFQNDGHVKVVVVMPSLKKDNDGNIISSLGSSYIRLIARLHKSVMNNVSYVMISPEELKENLGSCDSVIVQRSALSEDECEFLLSEKNKRNFKLFMEFDDDLVNISANKNLYYEIQNKIRVLKKIIFSADMIIVSTNHLSKLYSKYNSNVVVVDNYISKSVWFDSEGEQTVSLNDLNKKSINVLYMGTYSHDIDLKLVKDALIKAREKYDINLYVIGVQKSDESWFSRIEVPKDFGFYPKFVQWFKSISKNMDFAIAPLDAEDSFNKSKSGLKYLDYTSAGLCGIYSQTNAYSKYVKNGENGLIVENTFEAWYDAICTLASSNKIRKKLYDAAYADVMNNHIIESTIDKYDELILLETLSC